MVKGGASLHAVEVTNFIEHKVMSPDDGKTLICTMTFPIVRDFAYEVGILFGEGELRCPAPEINPQLVDLAFLDSFQKEKEYVGKIFGRVAEQMHKKISTV